MKQFVTATLAALTLLLAIAVISDLISPYRPDQITITPDMIIVPEMQQYEEVRILNAFYQDFHDSLGINYVYDHDWEETANALGIPVDSLTIDMYVAYLK